MRPARTGKATLDDLIDRILDKGVVVNLDIVIGIADIPLIGISLRAAVAAIETMMDYGMMNVWDERIRAYAREALQDKKPSLEPGERAVFETRGSWLYSDGIYEAWRSVWVLVTDRRLVLYTRHPVNVAWQAALQDIVSVERRAATGGDDRATAWVEVRTGDGRTLLLRSAEPGQLTEALEKARRGAVR